jgi:pentatricopeptide repeat protein
MGNFTLTREEKRLLTEISSAGKDRNWMAAKYLFDTYTGDAPPVYSAALHAAFTCREYREGARLYEQCRQRCKYINEPVYVDALRIFGKLREDDMVCKVWDEVLQKSDLNVVLASARIAAAADAGDPETAEKVLDLMEKKGIPINVLHMSSAIRACWGWGKNRHKAAKYFFDLCPQVSVTPNLIVFTCLIGAYKTAPLEDLTSAYHAMRVLKIAPDTPFTETYLISVLQGDKTIKWDNPEITANSLRNKPIERLQAARRALADFQRDGVQLTKMSRIVKEALGNLRV